MMELNKRKIAEATENKSVPQEVQNDEPKMVEEGGAVCFDANRKELLAGKDDATDISNRCTANSDVLVLGAKSEALSRSSSEGSSKSSGSIKAPVKGPPAKRGPRPLLRTSRYRGVSWFRANKVWKAQITVNGKYEYLGYFEKETDAAWAYDLRALEVHGPLAQLNFPNRIPELMRDSAAGNVPGKIQPKAGRKRRSNRMTNSRTEYNDDRNNETKRIKSLGSSSNTILIDQESSPLVESSRSNIGLGDISGSLALKAALGGLPLQFQDRLLNQLPNTSPNGFSRIAESLMQQQASLLPFSSTSPTSPLHQFNMSSFSPRSGTRPTPTFEQHAHLLKYQHEQATHNENTRQLIIRVLAKLKIEPPLLAQVIGSTEIEVRAWLGGSLNDSNLQVQIMEFLRNFQPESKLQQPQVGAPVPSASSLANEKNLRDLIHILIRQLKLTPRDIQSALFMSFQALQDVLPGGVECVANNAVLSDNLRLLAVFLQVKLNNCGMNEMASVLQKCVQAANLAV